MRDHALSWVDRHTGLGHDTVAERTRREYRRLLTTFAFRYFPPETRLGDRDRLCLAEAERQGLVRGDPARALLLPRRRGGRGWHFEEGRFLTRDQLRRVLAEIPEEWSPFFDLLASTGLRVSEAIALR